MWQRNPGGFVRTPEHLFQQAGPRDERVINIAVEALGQALKGIERNRSVFFGLLQLASALSGHAHALPQRF